MVVLLGTSLSGLESGKLEVWSERARDSASRARRFCLRVGVGVCVCVCVCVDGGGGGDGDGDGDGERDGVGVEEDGGVGNCNCGCGCDFDCGCDSLLASKSFPPSFVDNFFCARTRSGCVIWNRGCGSDVCVKYL